MADSERDGREEPAEQIEEMEVIVEGMGSYGGKVVMVSGVVEPAEEIMLLWGIQQPTFSKHNAFVLQSSLHLPLDACGRSLSILQSPSSLVCKYSSHFVNSNFFALINLPISYLRLYLSGYYVF